MTTRKLSERQVRWSQTLSEYDFQLEFRAGVKNGKPDALSRREQDTPQGEDDERLKSRIMKLVKDHWLPEATTVALSPAEIVQRTDIVPHGDQIFSQQDLQRLWDEAKTKDSDFHEMYKALATAERSFPPTLTKKVAISIAECEFDNRGALVYRQKLFIPDWEPLRTALIQSTHDSHVTGHPGRDGTLAILSRDFFWPGISRDTDGATERMNQEVLAYMRAFVTYSQYDWPELLPAAMLAINNRNTSMGVSPFFLTHGYHVDTIEQVQPEESPKTLEQQDAERFVERFREGWELAQAAMASRQQEMENQANKSRSSQERFEVGDLVWLKLKNISTPQISKKMSWVNAKYRVTKVVSPHVVELDVPTNIYPKFHVDLIKRAAGNPLPSQKTDDTQPPALEENEYGEPEYLVERILRSRRRRVGRGYRREVLVKWAGYAEPDWRPRADFEETEALETFEAEFGDEDDVGEPQTGAMTGPRTRMRGGGQPVTGSLNSRADALTRRYEDLVSSSSEEDKELCAPIIPPENFIGTMSLVDEVKIALSTDKWALDVISALRGQSTKPPDVDLSVCRLDNDGLLFVNDLLYLPNEDLRVRALKNCHDIMPSGHPGQKNTFELLVREYWWPGMRRDVIRYIRNCEVCQRIKSARHSPYGLLKPLTIPQARWTSVSLDFITGLPVSNSFDMILVVVDRLSKMAHFIPCDSSLDAAGFAKLYLSAVYRLHGLPLDIVSDRGSLFTSAFSKALAKLLGIKQNLSTAFHPQTDGQTERVNSILEQYLRGYTNYRQDNWADLLPLAEFSYNDSESSSTMLTPFFANHGFHPRSGRESLPVC
ncbi:uncharacterized protein BROUX77_007040 [Berkeleyomyces rouxiae]|uniref:uncharacterized protein n=1 Tax=Berkeleyomyces rouxiae TaxID=2035830 RepID=UPI003B7B0E21